MCSAHECYNLRTREFVDSEFKKDVGIDYSDDFYKQEPFYGVPTSGSLEFGSTSSAENWAKDECLAYTNAIASVLKYGGFYMGRFPMTQGTNRSTWNEEGWSDTKHDADGNTLATTLDIT